MARSRWKLVYFTYSIWRKIVLIKKNKKVKKRMLYDRSSSIPKCFLNRILRVHKGKKGRNLHINFLNIKKKFGEFSFPRKPYHFPSKKKSKKNYIIRR